MYGMIHRGLRQMVIETRGQEAWDAIEASVGTGPEHLISANCYDDQLTISIIEQVAARLGQSINEFLQDFGRYWVQFAAIGAYGTMMDFAGRDLPDFIRNLNRMHRALQDVMPEAQMPSFGLIEETDGKLLVEYRSTRSGLEPFVTGLLEGLLLRFGNVGSVQQIDHHDGNSRFEVMF